MSKLYYVLVSFPEVAYEVKEGNSRAQEDSLISLAPRAVHTALLRDSVLVEKYEKGSIVRAAD